MGQLEEPLQMGDGHDSRQEIIIEWKDKYWLQESKIKIQRNFCDSAVDSNYIHPKRVSKGAILWTTFLRRPG